MRGKVPEGRKGDIGICEIKFWNDEILKKIDNVPKTIYVEIEHLSPLSLRQLSP
ncbi:CrcB family camphor resistance protein [Haemophilus aegyptius ATCC 11116]|nr:CrcB family camphor resistance protein [Haemophilus aegyptius ATCC 11116]